ncbi:hypothetical protein ACGFWF_29535 [Streptomyces sp. NPDC048581]|uniref:hypothetical protein n=1 Tax=Streptomyces sp. NPDC048581 TaxID=3365572 RepID=UPI00371B9134
MDPAFDRPRSVLEGVGLRYEYLVRLGTFIVDHDLEKLQILGKALHARFGDGLPAQALSDRVWPRSRCRGGLFEADAVAVRP